MRAKIALSLVVALSVLLLSAGFSACGGGSSVSNPPPPPGTSTAPVSFTVRDNPPAGITVISFEVTVTGAVLQPGNVSVVSTPIEIELTRLETETAFLNTFNVPAGTYSSITVTFSNPELTILNNTGAAIGTCANGAACELRPPLGSATVSYSGAPFPLTIVANAPIGLLLDFDLMASIPSTLAAINPTITFSQLPPLQGTGQLEELEDVVGRVTAKDAANNQFTLQVSATQSLTVRVDAQTEFEDFTNVGCSTDNFACVAVGQVLEVDLKLMAGGTFVAGELELADNDNEEELEGVITRVISPTQFEMVLVEELIDAPGLDVGNLVTVNLLSGTNFRIDDDNFSVNSADFDSGLDLMVGQTVEVEKQSATTGTPPAFDTNRIKLKDTRFTSTVQAISVANSNFTAGNLPGLFTNATPAVTQLEVRTSSNTEFENVPSPGGLAGLVVGNTVSTRGLLFSGNGTPFVVAKKVRRR